MREVTVESDVKSKNWNRNNKGDEKSWYTNAKINKIWNRNNTVENWNRTIENLELN
jgi:hypothetical protein